MVRLALTKSQNEAHSKSKLKVAAWLKSSVSISCVTFYAVYFFLQVW